MLSKKYSRLYKEYNSLFNDESKIQEHYSLTHFFECNSSYIYEKILEFCINNNYTRVFDIGCAFGYQSEVFIDSNIDYVGIDTLKLNFWNSEIYTYISKQYPFPLKTKSNDIAVSVLCLTWPCYLYNGKESLHKQLSQLSKDFNAALLYVPENMLNTISEYFPVKKHILSNLYYFYKYS